MRVQYVRAFDFCGARAIGLRPIRPAGSPMRVAHTARLSFYRAIGCADTPLGPPAICASANTRAVFSLDSLLKASDNDVGLCCNGRTRMNEGNKLIPFRAQSESFKELKDGECYYIDKTAIIPYLITQKRKICVVTRPRRFGKTLMLRTLQTFFEYALDKDGKQSTLF